MASKPSTIVRWASNGGAQIVEPLEATKDTGFNPGERPPAQYFNFLLNLLGLWTDYLNDLEAQSLTWSIVQNFKNIIVGGSLVGTEANAVTARLTVEPAAAAIADWTLLYRGKNFRIWIGDASNSPLYLTSNADRPADGTDKWAKITTSQPAFGIYLARDKVAFVYMTAAQNTAWTDAIVDVAGSTTGWGKLLQIDSATVISGLVTSVANGFAILNASAKLDKTKQENGIIESASLERDPGTLAIATTIETITGTAFVDVDDGNATLEINVTTGDVVFIDLVAHVRVDAGGASNRHGILRMQINGNTVAGCTARSHASDANNDNTVQRISLTARWVANTTDTVVIKLQGATDHATDTTLVVGTPFTIRAWSYRP